MLFIPINSLVQKTIRVQIESTSKSNGPQTFHFALSWRPTSKTVRAIGHCAVKRSEKIRKKKKVKMMKMMKIDDDDEDHDDDEEDDDDDEDDDDSIFYQTL